MNTGFCGGDVVAAPFPLWLLAVTPEEFPTVNVPPPNAVMVNAPLFPLSAIPVTRMFIPTRRGGPEVRV